MAAEDDSITVSVPYYNCEFIMGWTTWRDYRISEFLTEALNRAFSGASEGIRMARYAGLLTQPAFTLHILGQPLPSPESWVYEHLQPGSVAMILTDDEAAVYLSDGAATGMTVSHPTADLGQPPLLRSAASAIELLTTFMAASVPPHGAAHTPVQRITEQYRHLMASPIPPQAPVESDEEDEEYVGPQTQPPMPSSIDRVADFMNTMLRQFHEPPPPQPIIIAVKKVLNDETFRRVCPIVNPEIATGSPPSAIGEEEENDVVGGPQDAGLGACTVCLSLLVNRIKVHTEIRKMPNCTHMFHAGCLSEWLTRNSLTCPVCREPAVTEAKDYGYLGYGAHPEVYTPAVTVQETPSVPIHTWVPARMPGGMIARRRA